MLLFYRGSRSEFEIDKERDEFRNGIQIVWYSRVSGGCTAEDWLRFGRGSFGHLYSGWPDRPLGVRGGYIATLHDRVDSSGRVNGQKAQRVEGGFLGHSSNPGDYSGCLVLRNKSGHLEPILSSGLLSWVLLFHLWRNRGPGLLSSQKA